MKKNILKLMASLAVLCFVLSTMVVSVFGTSGSSTTLHDPDKTAEFNQQDITVNINGQDYGFSASGNGSWKSNGEVGELNIPANGSLPVVITSGGNTYDASLVNHTAATGNNGNSDNGKDLYQITNIAKRGTDPTPPEGGDIDPQDLDPGEDPQPTGGENPQPTGGEPAPISDDPDPAPGTTPAPSVPKTGDPMILLCLISATSLGGYVMLNKKR